VRLKNPDLPEAQHQAIAKAVALGAIRYPFVSRENTKLVTFDWESALNFEGQAAPYIQYAYVRAGSILRKAGGSIPPSILPQHELTPAEVELVDVLSHLPNEVQRAAQEFRPLGLANLAYELARAFNDFYNQCPVLQAEESVRLARLRLVAAARIAIGNCLGVLGIIAPDAM
jgi:arginyl-tRNA synthetase